LKYITFGPIFVKIFLFYFVIKNKTFLKLDYLGRLLSILTNISLFFIDYKKKLYSFQEDAEQLEGFQTQEMAKIKHLVRFIEIIINVYYKL